MDPRIKAREYLDKHNIKQLFEILGSKLAVLKPDDPNAFVVSELSKIAASKSRGENVTLFDTKDMETMFSIFDITGKIVVTFENTVKNRPINIDYLDTGLYLVKISNDNLLSTKTLIVK